MKQSILILFLFFFNVALFAQTEDARIKEIETEIQAAAAAGDYELAASLKMEKELHLQIKEAVDKGDYEKAAQLKKTLEKRFDTASPYAIKLNYHLYNIFFMIFNMNGVLITANI